MNFRYFFTLLALVAGIFIGSATQSYAQHELAVPWDDGNGNVVQDALFNAVMGDTNSDGTRKDLDRIYVLEAGGYYWNYQTIQNNFPLRIVGGEPSETQQPAIIQQVRDITSGADPGKMISCSDDLLLRNLYIIGHTELGIQSEYQQIEINAVGKRFVIDNCVLDRSDFSILAWAGGSNNDIIITNSHFRNLIENPTTQQWTGRGISVWTDADTVIIENNTFFNVNMCAIQIENGAANYLRFNHNTLVNIGRAMTNTSNVWWREAYFGNLLLVNVYWHGDGASDYDSGFQPNRTTYHTGSFPIVNMPSRYGTNIGRRILFSNSAAYLDSYFSDRYADTIRVQPYTNELTDSFFTTFSNANGGQMKVQDTVWLGANPNFDVNPNTPAQLQNMYNHITTSRSYQYYGGQTQAAPYYYGLKIDGSDTLWYDIVWPLPEDFHYSDNLTGTDGLPLGDLNWFPNEKANFEANQGTYIQQLEGLAGPEIVEDVAWEDQAESGTLGGTAQTVPFTGDSWYTLVGGSSIEWTFDVAAAGPVDMVIKASISNSGRGEGTNIGINNFLNGSEIHDLLNWGEFVFWGGTEQPTNLWSGLDDGEFHEVLYTQAEITESGALQLNAGTNTVKLEYQWNSVSIARIDFLAAGTSNVVASLIPADAVNNSATPGGVGTWIPVGFNAVALGTAGTVAFNVDANVAGTYKVRAFYQNPDVLQTGAILLDGNQAVTFSFESDPDSGGLDVITGLFDVSAGAHTLTISGSGVNFDWLQVIRQFTTSVREVSPIPDGFALLQNYPNPFNPKTIIDFSIGKASNVNLTIYNILGQKVTTLINTFMNAGKYSVDFDASRLASGVYFYSIEAGDFKVSKKMMLLK